MKLQLKLFFIFLVPFVFSSNVKADFNEDGSYSRCNQVRESVVRPVMNYLGIVDPVLEDLLVGISAVESYSGKYLKQINGPALGLFQIEKSTYDWLIDSGKVSDNILSLGNSYDDIQNNHFYSTGVAISLLLWRMNNYPLPKKTYSNHEEYVGYITELGGYWKITFNTNLGKGTVWKFKSRWFESGCLYEKESWG